MDSEPCFVHERLYHIYAQLTWQLNVQSFLYGTFLLRVTAIVSSGEGARAPIQKPAPYCPQMQFKMVAACNVYARHYKYLSCIFWC